MFVPPDEVQLQWDEPRFFRMRTMGWNGLLLRGFLFLALAAVFSIASFHEPYERGVLERVVLVLLAGGALTLVVTLPSIQRRIVLSREGISWTNLYPVSLPLFLFSAGNVTRPEIKCVMIQRPMEGESRLPYAVLVVERKYDRPVLVAAPSGFDLENLARVLTDNGITVSLSDWSASAARQAQGR